MCYNKHVLREKWPLKKVHFLIYIGGFMIEKKVRALIEDEVSKMGIVIDSVVYEKEGSNYFLRIVIDRDQPIDIDTCVKVTKVINPIIDNSDIIDKIDALQGRAKDNTHKAYFKESAEALKELYIEHIDAIRI